MLAKKEKMTFECREGTDMEYGLKHIEPVKSFAFWKKGQHNLHTFQKQCAPILFDGFQSLIHIKNLFHPRFFFRHPFFMLFHDVYTKVKFAVVSYLVILEMDIAVWLKQQKEFLYEDQVNLFPSFFIIFLFLYSMTAKRILSVHLQYTNSPPCPFYQDSR